MYVEFLVKIKYDAQNEELSIRFIHLHGCVTMVFLILNPDNDKWRFYVDAEEKYLNIQIQREFLRFKTLTFAFYHGECDIGRQTLNLAEIELNRSHNISLKFPVQLRQREEVYGDHHRFGSSDAFTSSSAASAPPLAFPYEFSPQNASAVESIPKISKENVNDEAALNMMLLKAALQEGKGAVNVNFGWNLHNCNINFAASGAPSSGGNNNNNNNNSSSSRKGANVCILSTMSAEVDNLVDRLKRRDLGRFVTLLEMHLSFLLDLPGSSLEAFLDSSHATDYASLERFRGFGNFARKKSLKELRSVDDSSVFGVPLTMQVIERIQPLIYFLGIKESINKEGLFRKSGHLGRQRMLRDKIDFGGAGCISSDLKAGLFTVHDCANVLKQFLGELKDPVLSGRHYLAHCQVAEMKNEDKKIQTLQLLIRLLPDENFHLLKSLLFLLHSAAHSAGNLMTAESLGTIFAPHLLVPKRLAPSDFHKRNQTLTRVVSFMIEKAPLLFFLPEAVTQDIRMSLQDLGTRRACASTSDLDKKWQVSSNLSADATEDCTKVNTVVSFVDRVALRQAAAETDTVRALGELYAHIANLPESSKKRKLLKQMLEQGAAPVDFFIGKEEEEASTAAAEETVDRIPASVRGPATVDVTPYKDGGMKVFIQYGVGEGRSSTRDTVYMHQIHTRSLVDGKMFDLNRYRGQRFKVNLGTGQDFSESLDEVIIRIHVVGKCRDRVFEDRDVTFIIGEGDAAGVTAGLEQVVRKSKLGSKSKAIVKSKYAYGSEGNAEYNIPPDADLEYEVDLKLLKDSWQLNIKEKLENSENLKNKGTEFFKIGKLKLAISYYEKILEYLKDEERLENETEMNSRNHLLLAAHLNMAMCHLKMNDDIEACHACDSALMIDPRNEKGLFRRGKANLNLHNYEASVGDFKAVLEMDPQNKAAKNQLAIATHKIKRMIENEKKTYAGMFEKFANEDVKKTGKLQIWKDGDKQENKAENGSQTAPTESDNHSAAAAHDNE